MKSNLDCFYKIIKSVRKLSYDDLVYNLKEALSKAHKQADKDFLIWGLTCLNEKKMNSELTKEDVDFIEKYMEQTLGANIEFLSQKPFIQATIDAYGQGKKRVLHSFKMDYSLGDKDLGALQALQDFNCWWVREKVINQTNDIIQNLAKETLESGATRLQFADKLEKALLNDVKETKQYFDLLADHVLTKTQNMGHVSGYEEAGVEYVRIVAVLDNRTSLICRTLHDRIFEVKSFRKQYDNIISAAKKHDIEGVKAAQPMVNASSFGAMPSNMRTEDFQKMGLNMPPYHFHCRTTHVAYFEKEKGSVYSANKDGVWGDKIKSDKETKGFLTSYSDKELFALINQKKDWAKNDLIQYSTKDIKQDLTKHGKDFGFEIPKGRKLTQEEIKNFTSKLELYCNKTVRNAKNICINQWPETDGTLQISYYDGENIVVIGDDGTIRCAVKGNETNWLTWKKNQREALEGRIKMKKSWLIGRMESLLALREYNYDGSWLDIELGFPLYDVSTALEENPEYFTDSEVKDLFDKAMVAVKELVQNNIDNLFLLKTSLAPGRDLFPNKEKHWWWYIPDKLMNEEQLKEWKKYLKKDGYK